MYVLRPVASCSGSLDININKRGWRLSVCCGLAAALCLGWPVPAKMQAQTTASFSGTTTVLGSGFSGPTGVAVDGSGNVFVADTENNAVKEIVAVSGSIPASNPTINVLGSGFSQPEGIAADKSGNVFVADSNDRAVKEIDYADAPTLTFMTATNDGSTDTTDGVLSVTIMNDGNEPLTSVTPGLSVAANFIQSAGSGTPPDCTASFSLVAGASCNLSVEFEPVSPANGTVAGSVVLTDNNLNATSVIQTINLRGTAVAAPTVASISPASGPVAGGTLVTITGANFTGTTAVNFGASAATSFTVNSGTQMTAIAPTHGIGPVNVTVTTAGGTSATIAADDFTYLAVPTVASISPASGPLAGGTSVTITGANFTGTTAVSFGASPATSFTVNSGTQITATAPSGTAAGTVNVTVTTAGGNGSGQYTYTVVVATPVVASTVLTQNHVATTFTPVTGTGGTGSLTYSVMPTLPTGLSIAPATGTISGTPSMTSPATTYTVKVTDADSATATATFRLTVDSAVAATTGVASTTLTVLEAGTAFTPVAGTGGDAPLTYSVSPSLPTGLHMASATGTVSGTPSVASASTTYTVTVTDANLAMATATFSLGVAKQTTSTSVSATSTSITPTQTITLTATVAPAVSGTPTGTVTFFDNGTHLGSPVELTGSAAQLVVPGLLSGQHSITAVYGGDPNFSASTSAVAATVTVSTPDFTLNGLSVQSQNVIPGGVASYGFALAPLAGVYPAVVTFSVSGLPPGATASFSPASLSVNAGAQTVTLTVRTTATTAWTIAPSIGSRLATTSLALLLVPLFGASRMRRGGRKPGPWLCLLLLAGMATTLLSGCGGGGFAQSPKSYPLTITATSGALQHTTSVTLNEQ